MELYIWNLYKFINQITPQNLIICLKLKNKKDKKLLNDQRLFFAFVPHFLNVLICKFISLSFFISQSV